MRKGSIIVGAENYAFLNFKESFSFSSSSSVKEFYRSKFDLCNFTVNHCQFDQSLAVSNGQSVEEFSTDL